MNATAQNPQIKRAIGVLFLLSILILQSACSKINPAVNASIQENSAPIDSAVQSVDTVPDSPADPKILVAYFSCTGNTQTLAEAAAEALKADLYRIEALEPYTEADIAYYTDCRADREQNDPTARPEIAGQVNDMESYDTIVLGYPIWHGQAPRIISTFLERYDFSGKTIIPFCTSQSSGIGGSDTDLHGLCAAQWTDGKRFPAHADVSEFQAWLMEICP